MVDCVNTSGKRKTAIARAVVKAGTGRVTINKVPIEVFTPELARLKIEEPLGLVPEKAQGVDISVTVNGGGVMGQAAGDLQDCHRKGSRRLLQGRRARGDLQGIRQVSAHQR